ncbi:hypothetical protein N9T92_03395, partial [Candidatus Pelagibacter sp.]|nr:hypothetical protein [Candidatus Pelagibacter sp.]
MILKVKKNFISNYWSYLEKKSFPKNAKKIKVIDSSKFILLFSSPSTEIKRNNLKKIIRDLY